MFEYTTGLVRRRATLVRFAVAAALAVLSAGCSSAYMKSYSDSSKLAPTGAFGCVAQVVTEMGYMITDSVRAEGTIKAETQKPAVMSYDGRALVYQVQVTVTPGASSTESNIEVTTNNEWHARTILRTCSRKEEATEEEKQSARAAPIASPYGTKASRADDWHGEELPALPPDYRRSADAIQPTDA